MKAETLCILLFAKAPIAGQVKTRLQPQLGAEGSAQLQRWMIEQKLREIQQTGWPLQLWVDQPHEFWESLQQEWKFTLYFQQGRSLGERMSYACDQALQQASALLLTGSDCIEVDAGYLQTAADQLKTSTVVIGPALDGGYTLMGMKTRVPILFEEIDWGGSQVLQQTLAQADKQRIQVVQLPMTRDLDTWEDIQALTYKHPQLERWVGRIKNS